ncbi:MAG: CoA transferase, partial [Chloroflexi bacterium]|nr:CoA transferase [Chloroflexota bacterium]
LDIASLTGRRLLKKLAAWADIVIEDFAPGHLASLGLGADDLLAANPKLVLVSVTPFGQTGPYRSYLGTDLVVFALTTRLYVHGLPEREPQRFAPEVAAFQVGATAATAALGAHFAAVRYGIGQHVDVSAMEAILGNVDSRTLSFSYSGTTASRERAAGGYPNGPYPCADGYMLFAAGGDRYFRRLCRAIEMPELLDDPRFATPFSRPPYRDDFEALFIPWCLDRTRQEIFDVCQAARVMLAPINTVDELMRDPQMVAREFFQKVRHPTAGEVTLPGPLFHMAETPWRIVRPAPLLGEHNRDVYCDLLGYAPEDLPRWAAQGII